MQCVRGVCTDDDSGLPGGGSGGRRLRRSPPACVPSGFAGWSTNKPVVAGGGDNPLGTEPSVRYRTHLRRWRRPPGAASGGACTPDPTPLTLAHPTPDTELLAVHECVFEAVFTYDATSADFLRLPRRRSTLGKEQIGIDAKAVGIFLPALRFGFLNNVVHVVLFPRRVVPPGLTLRSGERTTKRCVAYRFPDRDSHTTGEITTV